jgi:xanthine dehydrogenase small subunit
VFTFRLNGEPITVPDDHPPCTLLDFVRARGLTGAKEGCAEGECGACAVAVLNSRGDGSEYRVINSCLMLLPMAADREICTVEALAAQGALTAAQEAMAAAGGSQCGYCTPGFVMSLFAEQYRPGRQGSCDVHALSGNLCRCTGYRPIRDAALSLGPTPADRWSARLLQLAPPLGPMTTPSFARPATTAECVDLLTADPDSTLVAGATDLGLDWNLKHRRFTRLISVEAIAELSELEESDDELRIGAGLALSDIARQWADVPGAVREWLELFASPLIRNRATLGGNLVTASPIGDAAPLLLALDAAVEIAGHTGRRHVPLSEFFTGYRTTALRPGELLVSIRIPKPLPASVAFYKVAKRRLDDISTVAAGFSMTCGHDGRITRARFALGGVAATPLLVRAAEQSIVGLPWNGDAVDRVQQVLTSTLAPLSDHRGSREYRQAVALSLVEKFASEVEA